jgi:spermidine synthase
MTLPRYVAATRPRSAQLVLEPAEEVTALVRRELPLPPRSGIKVRPVDGRTGLAALRDAYADVVVVDAFADARVPPSLVTPGAQADLARALAPDGVAVLNLTDRSPFAWTRRVVAGLRGHLPEVALVAEQATLRGRRGGNLVLAASRRALPVAELRARASGTAAPYRVLDARAVSDAFGGGRPFTEEDAEASPRPDAG